MQRGDFKRDSRRNRSKAVKPKPNRTTLQQPVMWPQNRESNLNSCKLKKRLFSRMKKAADQHQVNQNSIERSHLEVVTKARRIAKIKAKVSTGKSSRMEHKSRKIISRESKTEQQKWTELRKIPRHRSLRPKM